MATPAEFNALWATWNVDQRVSWLRFGRMLAGQPPPSDAEVDQVVLDWMQEQYGSLAAYYQHPELGPILRQAALEGWARERIEARVKATNFWRTTTEAQRGFDQLEREDPASAAAKVAQVTQAITTLLANEGVDLAPERVQVLARDAARNGTAADQLPRIVLAEVAFDPDRAQPVGRLGSRMTEVKSRADAYFVPMDDQSAWEWAKQIETGQAEAGSYDEYLRQQAKAMLPSLADRIDAGQTVRQLLAPQITTAANLLEIDPTQVDLRDPRFAPILQHNDGTTTREMTVAETGQLIRNTDDYWHTQGANDLVATRVSALANALGKA